MNSVVDTETVVNGQPHMLRAASRFCLSFNFAALVIRVWLVHDCDVKFTCVSVVKLSTGWLTSSSRIFLLTIATRHKK